MTRPPYAHPRAEALENPRHYASPGGAWRLPGLFFLVVLVLGAGAAFITPSTFRWPDEGSLIEGERAAAYETRFNEALPFRDAAISTWGVLEYVLFHEGREGVVVGRDGWLFTREEVAAFERGAAETARKLAYIEKVQTTLEGKGVALIVALVPDKARVYSEFVGRKLPSYTQNRYQSFRAALVDAGISAPDLLGPLTAAKADGQVYLRTDTHWTPAGAAVAAAALASALEGRDVPGLFESGYTTTVTGQTDYAGDLLGFLPLGAFQATLGPPPDTLEIRETQGEGAGGGLFEAVDIPITLVGTSYSANDRWNFAGALKEAFGADVLNLAAEGRGPLPPMRDYLESAEFRQTPPRLVVWELPERYLPAPEGETVN